MKQIMGIFTISHDKQQLISEYVAHISPVMTGQNVNNAHFAVNK